jgi:hypothetical protein
LTLTGSESCSVIQFTRLLVKWHVGHQSWNCLYLICIKFHYCTLLTLLIQISHNLHTYILYAAVFFLYYYKNDYFHIL